MAAPQFVAGVDSSTQSCKVLIVDPRTGEIVRQGSAPHPDGTEADPAAWWAALQQAAEAAGGLADVAAVGIGGQQHGMVALDAEGQVIRPALLWNDTRSGQAASDLTEEFGASWWADEIGLVPVASFTVTKLRWLADSEPDNAARVAAVALPHDWLTWKLKGGADLADLTTDRSDASGTGYFVAASGEYRRDVLAAALRIDQDAAAAIVLPRVLGPHEEAGRSSELGLRDAVLSPGCGDNAGAALGLGLQPGATLLSLGTSGVVASVSGTAPHDASGLVAGFADATGAHLPLVCTINGSRILDTMAAALRCSHDELSALALDADPGAGGLTYVPFLDGERTPNLPDASGTLLGMTSANLTPTNLARAAVEGLLCLMGYAIDAIRAQGVDVERVTLTGGAARSEAVRRLAPAILGVEVLVPEPGQYVALGAARQAAWVLSGKDAPPAWDVPAEAHRRDDDHSWLRERFNEAVDRVSARG
ncbi:xylulokinase [Nigerium massiliense]|uniref:xylulokinase n=1 Tax=Nigerium massiliense TaxID=1522317 RepID=UPI00058EC135|nr:xylulokinase [Nigerium massiliense]